MTAIYPTPPPMLHDVPVPTKSPVAHDRRRTPLGTAQIIQGNALNLPLPDSSVDLICTSPPYFGLRSYQDGCPDCSDASRANTRGYMERYCPGCNQIRNRNVCPQCGLTTLRTETTKQALRKTDCVTCGGTGKGHYEGQIGSEATPAEFLDALLAATREMVRVLKPTGSIFVNLGDKYANTAPGLNIGKGSKTAYTRTGYRSSTGMGIPTKSLMGLPWRYAIACIDQLGLILRAEIIWAKPNGLPESVTDRVRRSHEQWFHFTKQPRYFSAVDEIREAQATPPHHWKGTDGQRWANAEDQLGDNRWRVKERVQNPLGKLPGSVWSIPTQPLTVPPELGIDHFAAYPMEWPRRIILGWTPNGVCTMCGEGRQPTVAKEYEKRQNRIGNRRMDGLNALGDTDQGRRVGSPATPDLKLTATITGYTCACAPGGDFDCCVPLPPTTPAVVLDPFIGTGTTILVAKMLGRHGIGVDLSADYCRLAQWRVNDPGEMAKAAQVEAPPAVPDGQVSLFEDVE